MRTGKKSRMSSNIGPGQTFHYGVICPWVFPLTLNWENGVSIFSQLLRIQSSSNLQVTRTGIKSRTSSNFGCIWPVILELRALEQWKKWCLQLFSVTFDWIFVKLAGNEDRHKSSNVFEFWPDPIIHFGVIRPWAWTYFPMDLYWRKWCLHFFSVQSSSNLQVTRTGTKCWTGSISSRILPVTLELHALQLWKKMMSLAFLSHLWQDICQTCRQVGQA